MARSQDDFALITADSRFGQILSDLRARHAAAMRPALDENLLNSVREVEQGTAVAPGMAMLRAAQGDEIERLALIDHLTELYNTKTFFKELKDEIKRAVRYHRPVALAVISIDGLPDLLRQYGQLTGEAVLKIVANVIRSTVRENDIAARYTLDKFAIIFPEANGAGVALLADRIRQRIGVQAISHNWQNVKVTASIGLASFPADAREYDELIARAEEVLGLAIARGGDRVCMQ